MWNTDIIGRVWRGNLIDSRPFDDVRYENPRYAAVLQCRDNHDCMYKETVMIVCPNSLCRYMPVEGTEMIAIEVRVGEFTLASG